MLDATLRTVDTAYNSLLTHRKVTLDNRKERLQDVVSLSFNILDYYPATADWSLESQQAQQTALQILSQQRYDHGVGYVWVQNMERPIPRMLMHPTIPNLDNTILDRAEFSQATTDGNNFFVSITNLCRSEQDGFVEYKWPKPTAYGLSDPVQKLSYVRRYANWDWVIGTGVYIDDLKAIEEEHMAEITQLLKKQFAEIDLGCYMYAFNSERTLLIHPVWKARAIAIGH